MAWTKAVVSRFHWLMRSTAKRPSAAGVARIHPRLQHRGAAHLAVAVPRLHDVEEEAVDGHIVEQVLDMGLQELSIARKNAQIAVKTGFIDGCAGGLALLVEHPPFGVVNRGVIVPLHGRVNRHADVALVAGLDLLLQQVPLHVRVAALGIRLGVVVDHAVVAAREARDGVDPRLFHGGGELFGVEVVADAFDLLAGVEVEMDLTEAQRQHLAERRHAGGGGAAGLGLEKGSGSGAAREKSPARGGHIVPILLRRR
jgi:hypothetical protein